MSKRWPILMIFATIMLFSACTTEPTTEVPPVLKEPTTVPSDETEPVEEPAAQPQPADEPAILISEVLAGIEGNNNFEFIELTNTGTEAPFDLKGWSLWYRLDDG
jgi:hypothetical protein